MEKDLTDWIQRITQNLDELGGFSICPFAKKAMQDKKVYFSYFSEYEPVKHITSYVETTPNDFELVCFVCTSKDLTNDQLIDIMNKLQNKLPDMIVLKDHPDEPGFINGVNTGNGEYSLILVQPRQKLEVARELLKRTKYYDYWSEEYKNEIWNYGYSNIQ